MIPRAPFCDNPPGYENDPDEERDEAPEDDGDYREADDPADWPICHPLYDGR